VKPDPPQTLKMLHRVLLAPLLLALANARAAQEQSPTSNALDRVTIDVAGDGKQPMVVEVELPPPIQLHYNVTTGGHGHGPVVIDLTEEETRGTSHQEPARQRGQEVSTNREVDPEAVTTDLKEHVETNLLLERQDSETEKTTEPNVKVRPSKQVSEVIGSDVNLTSVGDKMAAAQVECPPCICMMGDHQRDAYLLGAPIDHSQGMEVNISQTTPQPTIASTLAATTSTTITTSTTTTTTRSTTTTKTTGAAPSPCESDLPGELCLSESCVMAAGTILTSLDRSVSPCDDFYQFSCGGWAQRSPALNMDRFQAIDKRNQNIIRSVLESPPPANVSHAEEKARTFYQSCVRERETTAPEDLLNLQAVLEFAGGWELSGSQNASMLLSERMFRLQNQLGVSALFTWGVIAENGSTHIAVVPGGWTEDQLEDPTTYLKLMAGISWLLAEASKCPVVEYMYDGGLTKGEVVNDTMEVEYEYTYDVESPRLKGIFDLFSSMFTGASTPEVAPGDYYDYDFIHETNDSDFLNPSLGYEDDDGSTGSTLDMLREEEDEDSLENEEGSGEGENPQKSSRDECMDRLKSEMDLGGEAMAALVAQRLDLEAAMRAVQGLEHRLRNLTTSGPDSTDGALTPITLRKLQEEHNFITWVPFLQRAFQIIKHDLSEDTVILINQEYLAGVTHLVAEYASTPDTMEVLKNYLTWRLVAQFYPSKYRDEARRGEQCLKQTEDVFGPVVTAMYVRHKTIEASKSLVEEVDLMVDTMKEAFSTTLKSLHWMTPDSQTAALHKLANMMDLIGYPEQVLNSTWLNAKYSEVEVSDDYLMNIVAFQSHQRKEGMKVFTRPYKRGSWAEMSHGGSIVTVNAFYSPNSNTMIVPIGMLQDPLYWSQPKSLTFGAFGIVVAHEITHAFDDSGINYNR